MTISPTQGFRCSNVHLELTSQCNLACVYCAVSQPGYKAISLSPEKTTLVIDWLLRNEVTNINLNGHGETTILPGWEDIVNPLLKSSSRCHLITNATKVYSDAEINTLCQLNTITISCDTFDPELHARLRRKSQLRNVLRTIARIRDAAKKRQLNPPIIMLSCVLGAENSERLEEFILVAQCMQIHSIQLCSLTEYPLPLDANHQLSPLSTLSPTKLNTLKRLLDKYMIECNYSGGLLLSVHPRILAEINSSLAVSLSTP